MYLICLVCQVLTMAASDTNNTIVDKEDKDELL